MTKWCFVSIIKTSDIWTESRIICDFLFLFEILNLLREETLWDGVPLPKLSVVDLKQDAIQLFKEKAVKRGRLTKEKVDSIISDERIKERTNY